MKLFRQVMRGLTPAEPPRTQHYRAGCPRGHVLRGERTEGYQALRCPTCGEGVFVLPRSPLPEPPVLPRRNRPSNAGDEAPARRALSPEDAPIPLVDPPPGVDILDVIESEFAEPELETETEPEFEAEDEGEAEAEAEAPPPPPPRRVRAPAPPLASTPRVVATRRLAPIPIREESDEEDDEDSEEDEIDEEQEPLSGHRHRRRRHLLTFVALAVLAATAITARVRQQWLQGLPKVVEAGRTLGLDALDAGRFDEAKDLLAKASYAAGKLGGQVEGAEDVRQGALEAAIYADLLPETLETMLDEVAGVPAEDQSALLARRYVGRSLILEGRVEVDPADEKALVLDYVVLPRTGGQRRGRISLSGLKLTESAGKSPGQPILCGVRIAGLERREGDEWRFLLQPESGVLLMHTLALDALGFSDALPAQPDPAAQGASP